MSNWNLMKQLNEAICIEAEWNIPISIILSLFLSHFNG